MNIKKHIPNSITLLNLLCGCLAILATTRSQLELAAYLIGMAAVFDFMDGMVARLLNVKSEMGKELDSLADMVSFGLVPAFILFHLLIPQASCSWSPYFAFLIALFSALRLAKFNIDTRQTDSFIGLPTPANAIFIGSLALLGDNQMVQPLLNSEMGLASIVVVFSYLLVSPIPLFTLKFKNLSIKDNLTRYIFLVGVLILFGIFREAGIPMTIVYYIILSVIVRIICSKKAG